MEKLNGLKIALCQMPVTPGRPDVNADYVIREIQSASASNIHIIAFPEMCVPGYIIGDLWQYDNFVRDVLTQNERIREATRNANPVVLFGSLDADFGLKGEDGRTRKYNAAYTLCRGEYLHKTHKFLQPNYRYFDEDRHFFSKRKVYGEKVEAWRKRQSGAIALDDLPDVTEEFQAVDLETPAGAVRAGIILCEDMWHEDYAYNPTQYLVEHGAEIIFNLSASPWGWQKNRKRHQVVRSLLSESPVPFVYVNNVGLQNNGKNLIVFDGSSAVYRSDGEIVYEIEPYAQGTHAVVLTDHMPPVAPKQPDDTHELYLAISNQLRYFLGSIPPNRRRFYIGLSGGIDSSLSAALYADALGPDKIVGVHMPFEFTHRDSTTIAERLVANLGIQHQVVPIHDIVEAICKTTGVDASDPDQKVAYGNVQARARMEVLAALAERGGGLFTANWNKVESAFGYGTLYADIAGALAAIGDLVKREVYQLADYMNRTVYGREVIPKECFERTPAAELEEGQQDPFEYGSIERRGYHDEMVRAFVEFRRDPEWFAEQYLAGKLEDSLKLEPATLTRLFPTGEAFIRDLEKHWNLFHGQYFKRVQACPVATTSKHAFGFDNREALLPAYYTTRYRDNLKKAILEET